MLATATSLRQLQLVLKRLENEIAAVKLTNDKGFTAPGSFLFDLLKKINLTRGTWGELSSALEAATNILTVDAVEAGRRHGSRASGYRLHELQEVFGLAFSTLEPRRPGAWPPHYGYRVHVHLQNQNQRSQQTPTLSYWCFNPGLAMEALADAKVRSIILTSGTLSPLGSFAHELGLPFEVRLENPHVIEPSQVWIGVVNKGPKGQTLNSSYEHRKNPEYKEDLGNAIVNYARIVPDGLLVFFPSYTLLSECLESWKSSSRYGSSTVWERISQYKASVIEPREAGLFPTAVADFRAKLDNPTHRGAVFFAVCRGKASEGLDFSDNAGRAVIITGIPYATKTDPKVQIKRDVLNDTQKSSKALKRPITGAPEHPDDREFVLNGNAWYVQQALRAVNQAMGRVIRHKKDFGAIILCDERFQQKVRCIFLRLHVNTVITPHLLRIVAERARTAIKMVETHDSGV